MALVSISPKFNLTIVYLTAFSFWFELMSVEFISVTFQSLSGLLLFSLGLSSS